MTALKPAPNDRNTFLIFRLFSKAFVAENEPMAPATQVGAGGPPTALLHANSCGSLCGRNCSAPSGAVL